VSITNLDCYLSLYPQPHSVDLFYVLYKGVAKWDVEDTIKPSWGIPMSFAIGAFFGVLWILIFGPIAKRRVEARMAAKNAERGEVKQLEEDAKADVEDGDFEQFSSFVYDKEAKAPQDVAPAVVKEEVKVAVVAPAEPVEAPKPTTLLGKLASNTWDQDLHTQSMHESHKAQEIWDTEEQFDENAESLFTFIQVFTACLNSFAHGANDVANTIAPMSAVIDIYQNGEVHSKTGVQRWLLAYGGLAIVLGLLLYGYRVMKSIGYKLTMMSPSRGSSAELGASLTVVTASFLGIPVSSTQCIVGAVTGVGLVGGKQSLNWWFFLTICCSWVGLFFVATTFSAGVFSFAYYAPTLVTTTTSA
jgi:sodium-dependent phosphate transporter